MVYINLDGAVKGKNLEVSASPSLSAIIQDISKEIKNSDGISLYRLWKENSNCTVGSLGFGSDYVPFLQHIGVSSIGLHFSGDYGVYHSNYDSFHWMEKFGDPTFEQHSLMTQLVILTKPRLVN
jgi:N-acetylated-alpha-linked acidic dipeptidase